MKGLGGAIQQLSLAGAGFLSSLLFVNGSRGLQTILYLLCVV